MTHFEYLAIAFSLVFSFAAVRLVGGIPYALAPGRRYWVHLSFVFHELLRVAAGFCAFWSFRDVTWTFPTYLLALVAPGLVYFLAATLVPADPTEVDSWQDFYFGVRRRYFLAIVCWAVAVATTTTILVQMPWSHPFRLVQLGFLAFGVVGASFASPRIHAGLALIALALPAIAALTVMLRPGSLAN
jgi:hypothetical protein